MSMTALGTQQIARRLYRSHRVHVPLPGPDSVDDAAVEAYQRDGFIAIEGIFSPAAVQAAVDGLTKVIADGDPRIVQFEASVRDRISEVTDPDERERAVRKLMWFTDHEARLKGMSEQQTLLAICRRLLGSDVHLIQDMALLKPPHIGVEKPWHQDSAYFAWSPPELIIGTWTALDPATVENGCMHVIPGSHQSGPRAHYHDRDCQLPDEAVDVERVVAVPLRPGGVLFFSALLHHGTPPNFSAARRRALQFHYASVNCRRIDAEEHEQMFHDHAGYAGCAGHLGKRPRPVVEKPERI